MKRWAIRRLALLLYRPAWLIATVVLTVADLLPARKDDRMMTIWTTEQRG